MSLGGDHFLGNEYSIADRAVLAFGQTSLSAGRSLCCIDYFCVAGRRDFFHTGEDRLTNGALRTGFMTSLGAGSGLFRNFNRSMSSRVDCFSLGCIANCAGVGLDTGVLTGRGGRDLALIPSVTLGRNLGLCNDDLIADGAVLALGLAGCGAGSCNSFVNDLGVSLGGDDLAFLHLLVADGAVGVAGVAGHCAGGVLGISHFRVLMCARRAAPDAVDIVDGVASLGGLRLIVGTVGIVQLGGGDGDSHRIIAICIILMGCGLPAGCALLNVLAGSIAGADVCAALGGVDGTDSRQTAVYIHLGILQICIGAVIGFTGRIGNRLELARTPDKVIGVPFVAVINVDIFSTGDRQASALGNIDLNARQQSCILIDGHIAGLDIDGDVVGDGQYVACRVDTHARKL